MPPAEDTIRILLVDDHTILRQGLRSLIQEQPGMTVVGEACDTSSALHQVRSLSPQVVVMDIHLGSECGIEVSRQLLTEFSEIKIVVLSADSRLDLVMEALQAGVAAYVLKANVADELIRAIREVLDHRTYLCPEISSAVIQDYMKTQGEKCIAPSKPVLTDRERQLLLLVAEGKRNKDIAEVLHIGVKSVETFRSRLMKKLGCVSANELTRYAIREGIAPL